ncbi:unnamed protein product [Paramecium octaurelia]|uniref:Transmembrane protein n=1 Tax=Paramecium octaurelia TaxID=43137 RepID=A0A8S1S114_PAROT|nr:unnamed protein product [Paramecium octaurelia]
MLGSIALLFFCIQFVAEGILDLVFPQENLQFQFLKWIDCETKEQVDVDGQQQVRLQQAKGVCLDLNNQLPLDEDNTYSYTFIFNRPLNQDQLYIFLDNKMYNLSKIVNSQPFVQIQQYHFLTCKNYLEVWLNSNVSINLLFFYITKVRTHTVDQVQLAGQPPYINSQDTFYYDFHLSLQQEIKKGTLHFQATVRKSQDFYSLFHWFKLYLNKVLLPLTILELDSNNIMIYGSFILANHYQNLNNLEFIIKIQYQIQQYYHWSEDYKTLEFETITQIDDTFSSLPDQDTLTKTKFKPRNQIRIQIEVQQTINTTCALITVSPKSYYQSIKNLSLMNAKINLKNEEQETFFECYFQEVNNDQSCLYYDSTLFQFQVNWPFKNNAQYYYELSGILKKSIDDDPFIFFQTDIELFPIINIEGETNKGNWIGYLLLIYLILPMFIFLFCVLCIISIKAYHPYIRYIIETDEIYFQPQSKEHIIHYHTTLQQQYSEEGVELNLII